MKYQRGQFVKAWQGLMTRSVAGEKCLSLYTSSERAKRYFDLLVSLSTERLLIGCGFTIDKEALRLDHTSGGFIKFVGNSNPHPGEPFSLSVDDYARLLPDARDA